MSLRSLAVRRFLGCFHALALLVVAFAVAGCGGGGDPSGADPPDAGPTACNAGELPLDGGGCQPAGPPADMQCPSGELPLDDGGCQAAGIPPEDCGQGFEQDGNGGCNAILPADPCPEELMAVPGDPTCHEVAPCGSGTWGDIPIEANTQFVKGNYAGGDSDGTKEKPWTHIQDGIKKAAPGAIVAVAAGSYAEDVRIQGKPVRLWGRCPAMVYVEGLGAESFAILIVQKAAKGSEIRGVAVTGANVGIGVSGALGVVIEGVRIHDTSHHGLAIQDDLGPTSVLLKGSLVEQNEEVGVLVGGADVTIESTLVRATRLNAQGNGGRGIEVADSPMTKARANVTVRGCLVEQNHEAGVVVTSSTAAIETTVVRSTLVSVTGDGRGIVIQNDSQSKARANVTVHACLVEQNRGTGVGVVASDATIEATVVRSNLPDAQGNGGRGIDVENDPALMERSNVTIRACLVEQNHELGVVVIGSDATIEATVVRSTLSGVPGTKEELGFGISIVADVKTSARAVASIRGCLVEKNHAHGVAVQGSDATIEATVVRSTLPDTKGTSGRGIGIQNDLVTKGRANVVVRACLVEENHEAGVFVGGSDATIEATVVRATLPDALGNSGNGIILHDEASEHARANVTVRACLVEENHGVGVFVVGSDATIEATVVRATLPDAQVTSGQGIAIQNDLVTNARANVTVRACIVEENQEVGLFVVGSDATIEATVVRGTLSNANGEFGRGVGVQRDDAGKERATVTVHDCLVEQNHDTGIYIFESVATIDATVVRETLPDADGAFGDGILVESTGAPAEVTVMSTRVEANARAGLLFDDSTGTLTDVVSRTNRYGLVLQGDTKCAYDSDDFTDNEEQDVFLNGDLPIPEAATPVPPESP